MGDRINVDFGAIGELGSQIDGQVNTIGNLLEDLRGQIAKLEETWEGGANDGFRATQNQWNTAANDLKSVLARIATAVHTANDNYQTTEKSNANRWS